MGGRARRREKKMRRTFALLFFAVAAIIVLVALPFAAAGVMLSGPATSDRPRRVSQHPAD